jgi:hypothetical protein
MALPTFSTNRVRARIRGGSSSPVVVETPGGLFVAKLRGAGHGVFALVAEIIVAELAERLGLSVPERVVIELLPDFRSDDRNDELFDLLRASIGLNVGFRLLEGAHEARVEDLRSLDDELMARVLWLDGLTMNPDRTVRNPNVLFWNRRPWLIDHGSALTFQHDWAGVSEDSPRERAVYDGHVFETSTPLLQRFDARLAPLIGPEALEQALAVVPDSFLLAAGPGASAARNRAAYRAFLWKRLKSPRPFLNLAT